MSEQILAEGKTCAGAYKAVESYARSNSKRCVPSRKATELVAEYWGLPLEQMRRAVMGEETQAHAENPSGASRHLPYGGEAVMGAGADGTTQKESAGWMPLPEPPKEDPK